MWKNSTNRLTWLGLSILFLILTGIPNVFAGPIPIVGRVVIDKDTTFKNVELDLSQGYFEVVNKASLQLENCIVKGIVSNKKPMMFNVEEGRLSLKNNDVTVKSVGIVATPATPSVYHVIKFNKGKLTFISNQFVVDKSYTVGLLATTGENNYGVDIRYNKIKNFHGGFTLKRTRHSFFIENRFSNVSITNILILEGRDVNIVKNQTFFSGNSSLGDAIDIIDSKDIVIRDNFIGTGACYGILILRSNHIFLERNKILGGITYAITIKSVMASDDNDQSVNKLTGLHPGKKLALNNDINIIGNYFSQNRYGLTASDVDGLIVKNNIFIQKFPTTAARRFWTDNKIMFKNVSNLVWQQNRYKEAYTQVPSGQEEISNKFVPFPVIGGVNL